MRTNYAGGAHLLTIYDTYIFIQDAHALFFYFRAILRFSLDLSGHLCIFGFVWPLLKATE